MASSPPFPQYALLAYLPTPDTSQCSLAVADDKSTLKTVVGTLLPFGPSIAEHVVLSAGLAPERKVAGAGALSEAEASALFGAVQRLEAWFAGLEGQEAEGFIKMGPGRGAGC